MTSSLVGSEMCIRDSATGVASQVHCRRQLAIPRRSGRHPHGPQPTIAPCLLYTSDAADDM
eukprot:11993407-Prorocentrum_lima.AAC.1